MRKIIIMFVIMLVLAFGCTNNINVNTQTPGQNQSIVVPTTPNATTERVVNVTVNTTNETIL